jgi:hypothetical protein
MEHCPHRHNSRLQELLLNVILSAITTIRKYISDTYVSLVWQTAHNIRDIAVDKLSRAIIRNEDDGNFIPEPSGPSSQHGFSPEHIAFGMLHSWRSADGR